MVGFADLWAKCGSCYHGFCGWGSLTRMLYSLRPFPTLTPLQTFGRPMPFIESLLHASIPWVMTCLQLKQNEADIVCSASQAIENDSSNE